MSQEIVPHDDGLPTWLTVLVMAALLLLACYVEGTVPVWLR